MKYENETGTGWSMALRDLIKDDLDSTKFEGIHKLKVWQCCIVRRAKSPRYKQVNSQSHPCKANYFSSQ